VLGAAKPGGLAAAGCAAGAARQRLFHSCQQLLQSVLDLLIDGDLGLVTAVVLGRGE
jgi:hypothetical protein